MPARSCLRSDARGSALIEALVAFLVLAAAGLAAVRLQLPLHAGADAARLGADALFMARLDIEQARSYATIATPASAAAGAFSYEAIASRAAASTAVADGMAEFRLSRTVVANADPFVRDKTVSVRVDWTDRTATPRSLALDTVIAGADPSLTGALWLARTASSLLPLDGRAPSVPRGARRLGDGTSLIALVEGAATVLRIDDLTGTILAVCPASLDIRAIAIASSDLATCTPAHGLLLSGHVRFDGTAAPDALAAADPALASTVRLALTAGGDPASPPTCATSLDAAGDGISYRCAVDLAPGRTAWSGSSTLLPIGWAIGPASTQHKVCRYSTDQDASGAVDQNSEHPAVYTDVTDNLMQQNFLVVRGDVACPVGTAL